MDFDIDNSTKLIIGLITATAGTRPMPATIDEALALLPVFTAWAV